MKAKGLVADILRLVNVKDSFTRMKNEKDEELKRHRNKKVKELELIAEHQKKLEGAENELKKLFLISNAQKRCKCLENVINNLFSIYNISVRESFHLVGDNNEGIIEQIDGVIEYKSHIYFVEIKWWNKPLGVPEISQHLTRVFSRSEVKALIISDSGFTKPAIKLATEALHQRVIFLATLEEFVLMLNKKDKLNDLLDKKIQAAQIDKNPFLEVL